jgi:haloacetate dehalogenase
VITGFTTGRRAAGEVTLNVAVGGAGPPLLLLHGYPQTHAMWHRVAPALARRHTVVAPDLRGYGDSDRPPGGGDHAGYAKRTMARDAVALMRGLGHERFAVAGHDRGARVAHRMALDHPGAVTRAAVLDIVPTLTLFDRTDQAFATAYWHWFFLIQPDGLPERMIGADPDGYLDEILRRWWRGPTPLAPEAVAEYRRCWRDPAVVHASCEDYRAAASIDLAHDREDAGRRLACPLLVLWGRAGAMGRMYDVGALWRDRADDVTAVAVPGGHFVAEEAPEETLAALQRFLAA